MLDLEKFTNEILQCYKLKYTYRYSDRLFDWEKDSSAAHSWSMAILADYFLDYLEQESPKKYKLNKLKIYEYIMYHDLIEAETGDIDNSPKHIEKHLQKKYEEDEKLEIFAKKIPQYLWEKLTKVFQEYEARENLESKFVKIMDMVEAQLQCSNNPDMRQDWTEEFFNYRYSERKEFSSFPELKVIILQMSENFKKKWYFEN